MRQNDGVNDPQRPDDARASRGKLLERFASTSGRTLGIAALVGVAVVLAYVALAGLSLTSALVAALAILVAVVCWMVLVRPGVAAYERVLLVRNIALDWEIPWHAIEGAEARQTLRIYTGGDTLHAVGVAKSTRQLVRATPGVQRGLGFNASTGLAPGADMGRGLASAEPPASSGQDYVAERVMTLAHQQREASATRSERRRRWALPELALLVLSVLAVVALAVIP